MTGGNITITQIPDPNTVNLVYATISIAVITAIGIGVTSWLTRSSLIETRKSNKLTQKSNEILDLDLKMRMRPILQFIKFRSTLTGLQGKQEVNLIMNLKNTGTVPARKITVHYKETSNERIEDLVREKEEIRKKSVFVGTILNDGQQEFGITIQWKYGGSSTKFVMLLEYTYLDKKEEALVFCHVSGGWDQIPHNWYIEEDIKEAEEHNRSPPNVPI